MVTLKSLQKTMVKTMSQKPNTAMMKNNRLKNQRKEFHVVITPSLNVAKSAPCTRKCNAHMDWLDEGMSMELHVPNSILSTVLGTAVLPPTRSMAVPKARNANTTTPFYAVTQSNDMFASSKIASSLILKERKDMIRTLEWTNVARKCPKHPGAYKWWFNSLI